MPGAREATTGTAVVASTRPPVSAGPPAPSIRRRLRDTARRHRVFLVVACGGAAGRWLLQASFGTGPVPAVAASALLGLTSGLLVYVLLLRWGVWRRLAAAATVPVLLDASVWSGEQLAPGDSSFVVVLVAAVLVLACRARPGMVASLCAGGLFAIATVAGAPGGALLLLVGVVHLLLVGATWRRRAAGPAAVMAGFGAVVLGHLAWRQPLGAPLAYPPYAGRWQLSSYLRPDSPLTADLLVSYQGLWHTPGPLLLGALVVGLLAAAGVGRAGAAGMRSVCLLVSAVPAAAAEPSWSAQLPAVALWPAALALGATAVLRGRRGPAAGRSQLDDVDRAAIAGFHDSYGDEALGPVVIVIAAYNEAAGLPRVLSTMPRTICGLRADTLVVDDGSTDETGAAAAAHGGCYVVTCPDNRGQGAAMRLGYRIARERGAGYIVTTDADGQYDTADMPRVLAPVVAGTADFVTGSRRLGHQQTHDRFRRAGVYVFAWTISALTGRRLTDTSFGLRAMRADLTAAVTLNQRQYQSAELLLGVHSHGYRMAEVPGTMALRTAGTTKKGGNLVYGTRYARVVLGTWWREGCPSPLGRSAPALATDDRG